MSSATTTLLLLAVVALAGRVAAADESAADFDLVTFAAQRWQLKVSFAQGAESVTGENATDLLLTRSFHFANQLLGSCVVADTPLQVRIEGGADKATATVHLGLIAVPDAPAAVDGAAASTDGEVAVEEASVTPLVVLRLKTVATGAVGARVATGSYTMLEGSVPSAAAPAGASALLTAKSGSFVLTIPNDDTFVLSLTAGPAPADDSTTSAPFLTIAGAGDAQPPALPWYQRFGPSGAMFAMFFVMRIFQGFIESRREEKEVVRRTMAVRAANKKK
jgi:hypothetical protein